LTRMIGCKDLQINLLLMFIVKKIFFYLTGDSGGTAFVDTFNGLHKGSMQAPGNTSEGNS